MNTYVVLEEELQRGEAGTSVEKRQQQVREGERSGHEPDQEVDTDGAAEARSKHRTAVAAELRSDQLRDETDAERSDEEERLDGGQIATSSTYNNIEGKLSLTGSAAQSLRAHPLPSRS